jgi:hypothetical protein
MKYRQFENPRPAPCALRPAPCALRPAPCALRPAPCALRPAPCALRTFIPSCKESGSSPQRHREEIQKEQFQNEKLNGLTSQLRLHSTPDFSSSLCLCVSVVNPLFPCFDWVVGQSRAGSFVVQKRLRTFIPSNPGEPSPVRAGILWVSNPRTYATGGALAASVFE